jgi:hypothetical protein
MNDWLGFGLGLGCEVASTGLNLCRLLFLATGSLLFFFILIPRLFGSYPI